MQNNVYSKFIWNTFNYNSRLYSAKCSQNRGDIVIIHENGGINSFK